MAYRSTMHPYSLLVKSLLGTTSIAVELLAGNCAHPIVPPALPLCRPFFGGQNPLRVLPHKPVVG